MTLVLSRVYLLRPDNLTHLRSQTILPTEIRVRDLQITEELVELLLHKELVNLDLGFCVNFGRQEAIQEKCQRIFVNSLIQLTKLRSLTCRPALTMEMYPLVLLHRSRLETQLMKVHLLKVHCNKCVGRRVIKALQYNITLEDVYLGFQHMEPGWVYTLLCGSSVIRRVCVGGSCPVKLQVVAFHRHRSFLLLNV